MNQELPDVQAGFRKGKGTKDHISKIPWIIEKESSRKTSTSASLTMLKHLCGSQETWKILKEIGKPEHFSSLLKNYDAGQGATIRAGHGTDWFHISKGVHQGRMFSHCLFNLNAVYLVFKLNARLGEAQTGTKIAGRNINNLRYADDTTLKAESEEELKNLLMKVKQESEKAGFKLSIQ